MRWQCCLVLDSKKNGSICGRRNHPHDFTRLVARIAVAMWLGAAEAERIALREQIMALAHPQFKLALHHIACLFAFVRVLLLGKSLGRKVGNQHFQLFVLRKTQ